MLSQPKESPIKNKSPQRFSPNHLYHNAVFHDDNPHKRTDIDSDSDNEDPSTRASTPPDTPTLNPEENQDTQINQNQSTFDAGKYNNDTGSSECLTPSAQCMLEKSAYFVSLIKNDSIPNESIGISYGMDSPPTERFNSDNNTTPYSKEQSEFSSRDFQHINERLTVDKIQDDLANIVFKAPGNMHQGRIQEICLENH